MSDSECDNGIRILDCTLRDGGYYTNWHFDTALVKNYLKACSDANISVVELGFRFRNPSVTGGKFAYSTDTMLKPLVEGSQFEAAVMINASDFFTEDVVDLQSLRQLFSKKCDSPVDWVRIAVKYDDFRRTRSMLNLLVDLGYKTGLNLMQAHNKTDQSYSEVANTIKEWKAVDVLYFADSFGCMDTNEIVRIASPFSSVFPGCVGFHSHNNRGLALANVLCAIDSGVSWIDSTMTGMGRGAGNVETELVLQELVARKPNSASYFPLVLYPALEMFQQMKLHYGWGPSPEYSFAANELIHPTYVQNLLCDSRYGTSERWEALDSVSSGSKVASSEATDIGEESEERKAANWGVKNWIHSDRVRDKTVVVLGPESPDHEQLDDLIIVAKESGMNLKFVAVNARSIPTGLSEVLVFTASRHRLLSDCDYINGNKLELVCPTDYLGIEIVRKISGVVYDFPISIRPGACSVSEEGVVAASDLSLMFTLLSLVENGARELILFGFSGDALTSTEFLLCQNFLESFKRRLPFPKISSYTNTKYNIERTSIYRPITKSFLLVIPARYDSSRFPGKPLATIGDKSLIEHVWDLSVKAVGAENAVVATDDDRIEAFCKRKGMNVIMTSKDCETGTDRVAEVAKKIPKSFYVNVQGDEPFVDPSSITKIIETALYSKYQVLNGMALTFSDGDCHSADVPKVVAVNGELVYMSRSPIPCKKNGTLPNKMYRQVCIYTFTRQALLEFQELGRRGSLEATEDIEILRFLDIGIPVRMIELPQSGIAIDRPEDVQRAKEYRLA